jgi:hypothetical protein
MNSNNHEEEEFSLLSGNNFLEIRSLYPESTSSNEDHERFCEGENHG